MTDSPRKGTGDATPMHIVIGGDHAGYNLKAKLVERLRAQGHEVTDVGTHAADPVDFPDIAQQLASRVTSRAYERGILVCGSGVGASIAANKIPGIRAGLCHDTFTAHQGVEHDDMNVLCLGEWVVGERVANEIIDTFLSARFDGHEDFKRRVAKLERMDQSRERSRKTD